MPVGRPALAVGLQHEALVEPVRDLARAERSGARRRELDGERQAVEPPAQPRHVGGVVVAQLEAGAHGGGPLREQPRRLGRADGLDVVAVRQASGSSASTCSSARPSDSRLVASTRAPGAAAMCAATAAALAITCSQLSSTTSSCRPATSAGSPLSASSSVTVRPPSAAAAASATDAPGSRRSEVDPADAVRRTSPASCSATRAASVVLPTPPGPLSVTTGASRSSSAR